MKIREILKVQKRYIFYIILGILSVFDNVSTYLALGNPACIEGNPLAVGYVLNLPLNMGIKFVFLIIVMAIGEVVIKSCEYLAMWDSPTLKRLDLFYTMMFVIPICIVIFIFFITVLSNFSCYATGKILVRTFF